MKSIQNIKELEKRREALEAACPKLPYGWKIGVYGDLYHDSDSNHCYQQDEAERVVKALATFYLPEEKL